MMKENLLNFVETGEITTWTLVLLLLCLIVLLAIFLLIWSKMKNTILWSKKLLEYQCDKLIYYLAQFQEQHKEHRTNTYVMESLFELPNPSYSHNYSLIVSKIEWLKASLNETVVPQTELLKLKKILKQLKVKRAVEIFLSILIIILVLVLLFVCIRAFVLI
jgi:lipopolysaccharide/colanic/teichoic acid biosynthesis glycosyltransferase